MRYAITVELGSDNQVLLEALAILGRQLAVDGTWQQWLADTPLSQRQVRDFLMRHSRDEDRIRIVALPERLRMLKHGEVRSAETDIASQPTA
jgi:hypothetical protein